MTTENTQNNIDKKPDENQNTTYSKEFVDKLLSEKKNAMAGVSELKQKINEYEAKLKDIEDTRLRENEDFKTLAEVKAKEAEEWKNKYVQKEATLHNQVKLGAIKKELEKVGVTDSKVFEGINPLIKLDAVKYDEATQTVIGAEEEVKRIRETLPALFTVNQDAGANHNAPKGIADMTPEAFNKLVLSPEWRKMSKEEQNAHTAKMYEKMGVVVRK